MAKSKKRIVWKTPEWLMRVKIMVRFPLYWDML